MVYSKTMKKSSHLHLRNLMFKIARAMTNCQHLAFTAANVFFHWTPCVTRSNCLAKKLRFNSYFNGHILVRNVNKTTRLKETMMNHESRGFAWKEGIRLSKTAAKIMSITSNDWQKPKAATMAILSVSNESNNKWDF